MLVLLLLIQPFSDFFDQLNSLTDVHSATDPLLEASISPMEDFGCAGLNVLILIPFFSYPHAMVLSSDAHKL